MTEMIKLTEIEAMGRESSVLVNADKIIKCSREKWQDGREKTLIEFGDTSLFVKETPAEIVKLIKEAESDRIKQKMDIVDEVVEHRKEWGLPLPMALPLPILASLA